MMKKLMTLSMGLLLLVVSSLGFLGCSDNSAATSVVQGTKLLTEVNVPGPSTPTAADLAGPAAVIPAAGVSAATEKLGSMSFVAPSGYTLSCASNAQITFSGNSNGSQTISATNNALPLMLDPSGNGNLLTNGAALLPDGQITLTFPPITMVPNTRTRDQSLSLTINNMVVTFTVANSSWTLPNATSLIMCRHSHGYYEINGSVATATWTTSTPPSGVTLAGLQLIKDGKNLDSVSTHPFTPVNNTITITGKTTAPFDTMTNATFTFAP